MEGVWRKPHQDWGISSPQTILRHDVDWRVDAVEVGGWRRLGLPLPLQLLLHCQLVLGMLEFDGVHTSQWSLYPITNLEF